MRAVEAYQQLLDKLMAGSLIKTIYATQPVFRVLGRRLPIFSVVADGKTRPCS